MMDSNQANDTGRSPWLRPQRAAVTSAKVRKTYRKNLVRFDLLLHRRTRDKSEVEDSGVAKADYNLFHDRLRAVIDENVPSPGKRHRKKTEVACKTKKESRRPSSKTSPSLRIRTTPLISQASLLT